MEKEGDSNEDPEMILREVIAPEILTHMISADMGVDYDDALVLLRDPEAREYGSYIYSDWMFSDLEGLVYPKPSKKIAVSQAGMRTRKRAI